MQLDLPTLMLAGSFVTAASGVFLILAWMQNREAVGMLWWAAGNLVLAVAVPLLASDNLVFGMPSTILGILLLNLNPALVWAAAQACNGRKPHASGILAGAVVWLLAFSVPVIRQSPSTQVALNLAVISFYLFAAATEFWRGRQERLQSRWPLIVLLFLHGLFFLVATVKVSVGNAPDASALTLDGWFGLIHFETLVFVVGTAVFVVAMTKERAELHYMAAARIDALTGVANRRAFMENAETLLRHCQMQDTPLSLIVFDLDWFKSVNDNFGHGTGDRVLQTFADLARHSLRASDALGRPGGEEFAVVLPGSSKGAAYVVAERIRVAFADACRTLDGREINATVSAGIAAAHPSSTVDTMMADADRCLYHAKAEGRNRVMVADRKPPSTAPAPKMETQAA